MYRPCDSFVPFLIRVNLVVQIQSLCLYCVKTWARGFKGLNILSSAIDRVRRGPIPTHPGDVGGNEVSRTWGKVGLYVTMTCAEAKRWTFLHLRVMVVHSCVGHRNPSKSWQGNSLSFKKITFKNCYWSSESLPVFSCALIVNCTVCMYLLNILGENLYPESYTFFFRMSSFVTVKKLF